MKVFYVRRWTDLPLRGKALVVISLPLVRAKKRSAPAAPKASSCRA